MRPIFLAKFAGTALTVKLMKQEGVDSATLDGMLDAIDKGGWGSVYVMQIEDGDDIAGMGGLMGTGMYSRGFAGAVIGGWVRDLPQLMRNQLSGVFNGRGTVDGGRASSVCGDECSNRL
jgi:regulator of RNase E activity RraA